jgi:N-acetylmuramoyl-L-alanine amidase
VRYGWALLVFCLVGCGAGPSPQPVAPTAELTIVPTMAATLAPTAAPTLEPTAAVEPMPVPAATQTAEAAAALPDGTIPTSAQPPSDPACDDTNRPDPLPAPGSARSQDFFRSFRTPLAPAPLYDPPGPRRVGLQAGHWLTDQVPPELGRLQAGSVGGGKQEWQVNLDVAQRTAALLEAAGVQVDVLPSTIPARYRANAFIALHADGDPAGQARGFKVARPGFSSLPDVDDRLVDTLNQVYAADTELPRDDEHISLRMRYYYAFNSRRYCHAVAPGVPQAIIEMGYLTSATDRQWLIGNPDRLARGVANGIQTFLATLP